MTRYDLCLTWYSEYDADLVHLIDSACRERGISLWNVRPANFLESITALYTDQAAFGTLFDRAADDLRFAPIANWAKEHGVYRINAQEVSAWAEDKATMHLELISSGLYTPYTIILAPFVDQPILPPPDLSPLGERFVLKPAYGGGGEGVMMHVTSLEQVLKARTEFPDQKYLIQAYVVPDELDGREAWFRVIYFSQEMFLCWWNTHTHVYTPVTAEQETHYALAPLRDVTQRIAAICKLDFFSTEIAYTPEKHWVVVDYVNDNIDLRLQSKAGDGVPDAIVKGIARRLVELAQRETTTDHVT
jgi:hypothetical protein